MNIFYPKISRITVSIVMHGLHTESAVEQEHLLGLKSFARYFQ